jgi:hypothetical protein
MSTYIRYGFLKGDQMSDAGAGECCTRRKLAVVWSRSLENQATDVDVGAVRGSIDFDIALCLSESAMQGREKGRKAEKEALEAHGCMWISSCICVRNVPIQLVGGIGTRWVMCYKPYLYTNSTRCLLIFFK